MKKFVYLVAIICSVSYIRAQEPVTWKFAVKKIDPKTFEIHLSANLEAEWHLYSQSTPAGGPVPTSVTFAKNPLLVFEGGVKEVGNMEKHFEKLFGVQVFQFSDKVDFVQTVKLKSNVKTSLSGTVEFMVCNDEMCLPPKKVPFNLALK
ncbi:MAG TPA: protein-disulfide reductase DsbD domain-containing protein [Chitinophagaceae bacterium]|jgi:thiol:disulfide interchange protein DsbD|nr:protein-disulfide reductase DsbD domain-containing protein [Chitinophagaceae bacterium]